MSARYVAKRPRRGYDAQIWDGMTRSWIAGTASPFFHEVAAMAEMYNRRLVA